MVEVVVRGALQSTDKGSCVKEEQERLLLDATNVRTDVDIVKSMENDSRVQCSAVRIFVDKVQG
jgi:hypothetical protein